MSGSAWSFPLRACALAVPLMLGACASSGGKSGDAAAAPSRGEQTGAQVAQAVTAPLGDLNIVRAEIPPVLKAAQKGPYELPADRSCAALLAQVKALDAVLGADLDVPPSAGQPSLLERGTDAAGSAAVSAVRNTTEGVVPFRGWVRKLTGAERYAREVNGAIAAGTVRRAYLKGLGQAAGCEPPAAPRVSAPAQAASAVQQPS
ncbi:hypothetical protein LZ017_10875 [Pelomonas sp. CA6]|uniref:hypothetical protein n=1 Tax=Pelomonas sp. CA6 TaxID=2907999 RepID=UPI001F4BF1DA|nr:hypothetical protein [Pelomonas sp. CA6]MCH7343882.1 hypothetical protein [Pelomonas sp. CA6]